ncbi:MAG: hypothetical protein NTX03_13125 [Bacteroidetes bacterium]|nr:hypothetical protein [Bacteroidota bacterium]
MTPIFIVHASAGSVMLLSGLVAMLAKKANKYHRMAGKIYLVAAALVSITGFTIAIQKNNQFLIATSVFVLYMVMSGYRSLYLKQLYKDVKAMPMDWLIIAFASLATVGLLLLGVLSILKGNNGGIVPLTFGIISATFIRRDILKFTKGPVEKKHWLYNHIRGMVGSYIAGLTAFLAVNAGFISHNFSLLVWLSPTAIGVPLIIYWTRKYKTKSDDLSKELGLKIRTNAAHQNQ